VGGPESRGIMFMNKVTGVTADSCNSATTTCGEIKDVHEGDLMLICNNQFHGTVSFVVSTYEVRFHTQGLVSLKSKETQLLV